MTSDVYDIEQIWDLQGRRVELSFGLGVADGKFLFRRQDRYLHIRLRSSPTLLFTALDTHGASLNGINKTTGKSVQLGVTFLQTISLSTQLSDEISDGVITYKTLQDSDGTFLDIVLDLEGIHLRKEKNLNGVKLRLLVIFDKNFQYDDRSIPGQFWSSVCFGYLRNENFIELFTPEETFLLLSETDITAKADPIRFYHEKPDIKAVDDLPPRSFESPVIGENIKIKRLETELADLKEEWEAACKQFRGELVETARIRLRRHIENLEEQITNKQNEINHYG